MSNGYNGNGTNGNGEMMRRVAENTTLTAVNRIAGAIGLPIMIGLLIWFGTSVVDMRADVAVIKFQIGGYAGDGGLVGDVKDLEDTVEDHDDRLDGLEGWVSKAIGVER